MMMELAVIIDDWKWLRITVFVVVAIVLVFSCCPVSILGAVTSVVDIYSS